MSLPSGRLQDLLDGGREPPPVLGLFSQLFAPGSGQFVILRLPVVFRHAPLGVDPPPLFQPQQRRIERPLVDDERPAGNLLNALGDAPAVHRLEGERLENEQVQRPLQKVRFRFGHDIPPDFLEERYTSTCRRSREEGGFGSGGAYFLFRRRSAQIALVFSTVIGSVQRSSQWITFL